MPFLGRSSASSARSSSDGTNLSRKVAFVEDEDYVAVDFENYGELPLSEQLEPIAVVGMGKSTMFPAPQSQDC
jgi:hypothetical protein